MESDGKPIMGDTGSSRVENTEAPQTNQNERDRFPDKLLKRISLAQMIVGGVSIVLGLVIVILGANLICEIYCYEFNESLVGAGMWCGLMFIGVGILANFASRKRTTCVMVALLVVGLFTIVFAGAQITLSVISASTDRNKIKIIVNETNYNGGYRVYNRERREIPVALFTLNIILALLGLVMIGLLIASSIVTCSATCCRPRANYLNSNMAVCVPTAGGMQVAPQAYMTSGGQMYYVPQGYGGNPQATMQPMVMMPMNPQAPVQYQVVGQTCPPYQSETSIAPAAPSPGNPSIG